MNKEKLQRRIEEMGLNGWPSISTQLYKGAVLRYANGYTKRANSCNPLYVKNININDVINYTEDYFNQLNQNVVFKIIDTKEYSEIDKILDIKGYSKIDLTDVLIIDLKNKEYITKHEIKFENCITDEWVNNFIEIYDRSKDRDLIHSMLNNIKSKVITAQIDENNRTIACGYAVIENDWVGFFDIYVDEKLRGKGLGRSIMNGLINQSKNQGAVKSYIQVVSNNTAAVNLYKSLGYEFFYNYWYRSNS